MKNKLLCLLLFVSSLSYAQVGIGTTTPKAYFNVPAGRTILFGEDSSGAGSKLIWYASQGAFRAGAIDISSLSSGNQWNYANIGKYSFASGINTTASAIASTAIGYSATATGYGATAIGNYVTASGYGSVALGGTASGNYATAMGTSTLASGYNSVAMGQSCTAPGYTAIAIGYANTASGQFSTAMGAYVSTNNKNGAFIIGDANSSVYTNSVDNQMMMRFKGGYQLYSTGGTDQNAAVGVYLPAGGNAWTTISDSTRKENFRPVDAASFLQKIARMRLGSWNYKGQEAKIYRHYGPMAQDFFAAFGRDELGTIGEDKSINQADFDGVNLIAIQALIKEVNQLKEDNNQLRQENAVLKNQMQARLEKIEAMLQRQTSDQVLTLRP